MPPCENESTTWQCHSAAHQLSNRPRQSVMTAGRACGRSWARTRRRVQRYRQRGALSSTGEDEGAFTEKGVASTVDRCRRQACRRGQTKSCRDSARAVDVNAIPPTKAPSPARDLPETSHQTSRTGDDTQGETATRRMRSRRTNKVLILSPGFNQSVGPFASSRYIPSTHDAVDSCRGDDAKSRTRKGPVGIR